MTALAWLATLCLTVVLVAAYRAAWQRARLRRDAVADSRTEDSVAAPPVSLDEAPLSSPRDSDRLTTLDVDAAVRVELATRGYSSATVRVAKRRPRVFIAEVGGVPLETLRSAEARLEEWLPPDVDCELRVGLPTH